MYSELRKPIINSHKTDNTEKENIKSMVRSGGAVLKKSFKQRTAIHPTPCLLSPPHPFCVHVSGSTYIAGHTA